MYNDKHLHSVGMVNYLWSLFCCQCKRCDFDFVNYWYKIDDHAGDCNSPSR